MNIAVSSLRSAFEAVKENQGCAGADGISISQFEMDLNSRLSILQDNLYRKTYRPVPLLKLLVTKSDGGARKLCIPSVCDRVVQKAILNLIEPVIDQEFEDCSYAYRKGRSVRQAIIRITQLYSQGYEWIVDADIDDFFDSIDHGLLMEKFETVIQNKDISDLVRLWIKTEIWDGHTLQTPDKGIPQGSPISPLLSNLFLDELDEAVIQKGFKYIRFADDFIILGKNEAEAEKGLLLSREVMERLRLDLEDETITTFEKGFSYLGVTFLNDLVMKPFDLKKKQNRVISFPEPLDMAVYLKMKSGE